MTSHRRVAVTTALMAFGLAACTNAKAADEATGRAVTDAKGATVSVPDNPGRVVTLSEPTLDGALALGVNVVGTTSGRGQGGVSAYLSEKAAGIPVVASVAGPDIEEILKLKPDLILTDGTVTADDSVLGKLKAIAPTVYVGKTAADWKTEFTAIGQALNKTADTQKVLSGYAGRVADIKSKLGANAGDTVSIVRWGTGQPSVLLKELPTSKVIADLGLRRPPAQDKDGQGHSQPVSRENLDQLDADWMFFGTLGGSTNPGGGNSGSAVGVAASQKMLSSDAAATPGFTQLTAYREHHVIPVDGSAWTSSGGPLAATVVLDEVADAMTPKS